MYLGTLLFFGFGVGIIDAGLNAYIAGLPDNTAPLNYLHAFYGVGALRGPVIASAILAIGLGWNFVYLLFPTTIALLSDLVPARLRQSTIGFVASLGSMGAAFLPWIAGNLAQTFGLWTLPFVIRLIVILFALWFGLSGRNVKEAGGPLAGRLSVE